MFLGHSERDSVMKLGLRLAHLFNEWFLNVFDRCRLLNLLDDLNSGLRHVPLLLFFIVFLLCVRITLIFLHDLVFGRFFGLGYDGWRLNHL